MKPLPNAAPKPKRKNKAAAKREEWSRIYGSKERVEWVKSLKCATRNARRLVPWWLCGPSENAHTETGGIGRKADAEKIVPLCNEHHRELHRIGKESFEALYRIDLDNEAAETEQKWKVRQSYNQPNKEDAA